MSPLFLPPRWGKDSKLGRKRTSAAWMGVNPRPSPTRPNPSPPAPTLRPHRHHRRLRLQRRHRRPRGHAGVPLAQRGAAHALRRAGRPAETAGCRRSSSRAREPGVARQPLLAIVERTGEPDVGRCDLGDREARCGLAPPRPPFGRQAGQRLGRGVGPGASAHSSSARLGAIAASTSLPMYCTR